MNMRPLSLILALAALVTVLPAQTLKPAVAKTQKPVTSKPSSDTTKGKKTDAVKSDAVKEAAKGKQDPAGKKAPAGKGDAKKGDAKKGDAKKGDAKKAETEAPKPVPAGADPADLRAIQGAQAMLDAEKGLKKLLKTGKIKGIDQILTFEEISSWPYEDGLKGLPKGLKKLDKKKVMMIGFMLPIDEVEEMKEFLLVQSLWSCCYGQPPDINGIVRVVMKGKSRSDYFFDPIKMIGEFRVEAAHEDGYCVDIYQLHTSKVEVIK